MRGTLPASFMQECELQCEELLGEVTQTNGLFVRTVPQDYLLKDSGTKRSNISRSEKLLATAVPQNSPKKTRMKKTLTTNGVKRTPMKTCKPKGINYSYEISKVIEQFNTLSKPDVVQNGENQRRHSKHFTYNCESGRNCGGPMEGKNGPELLFGTNGDQNSGQGLLEGPTHQNKQNG